MTYGTTAVDWVSWRYALKVKTGADLSPKLPVSQLVTQPIQPWPSLLTALSPVAGGAGALWQLMTGGADQKRCVHWLVRVDIMVIKWLT